MAAGRSVSSRSIWAWSSSHDSAGSAWPAAHPAARAAADPDTVALAFFATTGWLLLTQSGLERAAALAAWASDDAVRIAGARGRPVGPLALDRAQIAVGATATCYQNVAIDWDFSRFCMAGSTSTGAHRTI
ncbi:MAG: hypothetical protein IPK39_23395 [Sulfuritalea sp.]|nr:hypothetical protein [Sulfuritalea sp.]